MPARVCCRWLFLMRGINGNLVVHVKRRVCSLYVCMINTAIRMSVRELEFPGHVKERTTTLCVLSHFPSPYLSRNIQNDDSM
jgi:hypothetical protein